MHVLCTPHPLPLTQRGLFMALNRVRRGARHARLCQVGTPCCLLRGKLGVDPSNSHVRLVDMRALIHVPLGRMP